jgi:hypothetical protein
MKQVEFQSPAELEEVANGLARASRHPIHVDLGGEYAELGTQPLSQTDLEGGTRVEQVEPLSSHHVVWNNRDDRLAYIGSERYNLVQHRELIDAIREALSRTTASVEKGYVRDYGEHVNGVVVFGDRDDALIDVEELVDMDEYVPPEGNRGDDAWGPGIRDRLGLGMRFHNSFDGRSGLGGSTMGYRFICQNWMVWGEETISSKENYHLKSEEDAPGVDPDYFEDLIFEVFEQRDALAGVVKESIEEGSFPTQWVPRLLEDAGFGKQYRSRIAAKLMSYGIDPEGEVTLWDLYNAATDHIDHDAVGQMGPERYDHHQGNAWRILTLEPRSPEAEEETLEAYV